jgi:hypothetical protein
MGVDGDNFELNLIIYFYACLLLLAWIGFIWLRMWTCGGLL